MYEVPHAGMSRKVLLQAQPQPPEIPPDRKRPRTDQALKKETRGNIFGLK